MYSIDKDGCFTREYLVWVVGHFSPKQVIASTNCNSVPRYPGDYCITYGTAQELLDKLDKGEKTRAC